MKRNFAYASLMLLGLLAACPGKKQVKQQAQTPPPDFDAIRQDADRAQKALDQEKGPLGQ